MCIIIILDAALGESKDSTKWAQRDRKTMGRGEQCSTVPKSAERLCFELKGRRFTNVHYYHCTTEICKTAISQWQKQMWQFAVWKDLSLHLLKQMKHWYQLLKNAENRNNKASECKHRNEQYAAVLSLLCGSHFPSLFQRYTWCNIMTSCFCDRQHKAQRLASHMHVDNMWAVQLHHPQKQRDNGGWERERVSEWASLALPLLYPG